jgi:hypothetical protein
MRTAGRGGTIGMMGVAGRAGVDVGAGGAGVEAQLAAYE